MLKRIKDIKLDDTLDILSGHNMKQADGFKTYVVLSTLILNVKVKTQCIQKDLNRYL